MGEEPNWRRLCGLAIQLVGQEGFKKEARILSRLYKRFGPVETERFLIGAQLMQWTSLRSLGSADGLGRRMALVRFWQDEKRERKAPQALKQIFREMAE